MKKFISAIIVLMLFMVTGCFPIHRTASPAVVGTVLNAETREPISGAETEIAYYYPNYSETNGCLLLPPLETLTDIRPPVVFTKGDGSFFIPAEIKTDWVAPLPMDPVYPDSMLLVKADGYATVIMRVERSPWSTDKKTVDMKEILLRPKK